MDKTQRSWITELAGEVCEHLTGHGRSDIAAALMAEPDSDPGLASDYHVVLSALQRVVACSCGALEQRLRAKGWALYCQPNNGHNNWIVELRETDNRDAVPIVTLATPTLEIAFDQIRGMS